MAQVAIEAPRLTWAGTGSGVLACPCCEQAVRVASATSAQGLTRCPHPACGERLYVRIGYEWRDGAPRLFRDNVQLEALEVFRRKYLAEYRPGLRDYLLGRWRDALPVSFGSWGLGVAALWGVDAAVVRVPVAPAAALLLVASVLGVSFLLGRSHVCDTAAWHQRTRRWAERILAGEPTAQLEQA